jgi:hypothetical protein
VSLDHQSKNTAEPRVGATEAALAGTSFRPAGACSIVLARHPGLAFWAIIFRPLRVCCGSVFVVFLTVVVQNQRLVVHPRFKVYVASP